MTRRRVLLLGAVAVVAALVVAVWMVWPRPSAITEENAAKIQLGMTLEQVETILGGPQRDETVGVCVLSEPVVAAPGEFFAPDSAHWWTGSECCIVVWFANGRAGAVRHYDVLLPADETLIQRLRRWMRL